MEPSEPTGSTERRVPVWLERLALLVGSPVLFIVVAELAIWTFGIETDVARNENAQIAVPVWLLADQAWVMDRRAERVGVEREPVAAEDLAWMYHFEEARWIQYRMKPHVDTRVVNPFNKIEVEKNVTFGLRSNSDGFRGDEIRAKQPGVTRIVTIGASSTFGWGVEPEHTFQHILETKLNKRQPGRYEIINLGIPGQNSRHGLGMLRHYALPLQPDLLVISYGSNDPHVVPVPTAELLATDHTSMGALRFEMLKLRTYRLLRRLAFTLRNPLAVDPAEAVAGRRGVRAVSVDDYRKNLIDIVLAARQAGAQTLLMSVCTRAKIYVANINGVSRSTNSPILNVGPLFKERRPALADGTLHPDKVRYYRSIYGRRTMQRRPQFYVTNDGCHPNWVGHSLIAEEMLPLVRKTLRTRRPRSRTPENSP